MSTEMNKYKILAPLLWLLFSLHALNGDESSLSQDESFWEGVPSFDEIMEEVIEKNLDQVESKPLAKEQINKSENSTEEILVESQENDEETENLDDESLELNETAETNNDEVNTNIKEEKIEPLVESELINDNVIIDAEEIDNAPLAGSQVPSEIFIEAEHISHEMGIAETQINTKEELTADSISDIENKEELIEPSAKKDNEDLLKDTIASDLEEIDQEAFSKALWMSGANEAWDNLVSSLLNLNTSLTKLYMEAPEEKDFLQENIDEPKIESFITEEAQFNNEELLVEVSDTISPTDSFIESFEDNHLDLENIENIELVVDETILEMTEGLEEEILSSINEEIQEEEIELLTNELESINEDLDQELTNSLVIKNEGSVVTIDNQNKEDFLIESEIASLEEIIVEPSLENFNEENLITTIDSQLIDELFLEEDIDSKSTISELIENTELPSELVIDDLLIDLSDELSAEVTTISSDDTDRLLTETETQAISSEEKIVKNQDEQIDANPIIDNDKTNQSSSGTFFLIGEEIEEEEKSLLSEGSKKEEIFDSAEEGVIELENLQLPNDLADVDSEADNNDSDIDLATQSVIEEEVSNEPDPELLNIELAESVDRRNFDVFDSSSIVEQEQDAPEQYKLRVGDTLFISMYGETDSGRTVTIDSYGSITYPLAGRILAVDLTIDELKQKLNTLVTEQYKFAMINVVPVYFGGQQYTILGMIQSPGKKMLNGRTNLLNAISQGGGFVTGSHRNNAVDLADLTHAFVARDGEYVAVDFENLVEKGDFSNNIEICNGDYIFIPNALVRDVYILGEVLAPSTLGYRANVTLIEAIAQARGMAPTAGTYAHIIRGSLTSPKRIKVNYFDILSGRLADVVLQPGDIVYVPPRRMLDAEEILQGAIRAFMGAASAEAGKHYFEELEPDAADDSRKGIDSVILF